MLRSVAALLGFNRNRRSRPIPGPFAHEREARGLVVKTKSKNRPR